jgi:hypothetical protein
MLASWTVVFLSIAVCAAQSTEGLISGRVLDVLTDQGIGGETVTCLNESTHTIRSVVTGQDGGYSVPLLPPGTYRVQVSGANYRSVEQDEVSLGVSEALDLNFQLRPIGDLWESALRNSVFLPDGLILNFHGPDVDPNHWTTLVSNPGVTGKLEASVSDAVSPADIRQVPLNGENVYAILLAEPGVTADAASSRSLGIAANGQRPSASNFLLDGVEVNFYLVSGPLLSIAPEATQEYRLSTNNFSAEYGRASGYVANAVTRSGGEEWHGTSYLDLLNTIFNANDFQANSQGLSRTPDKETRLGGFIGGPILKGRLFSGTSFQYFRSRSQEEPQTYNLPNATFLQAVGCPAPNYFACQLLQDYPLSSSTVLDPFVAAVTLSQPVSVNQWFALERLDYATPGGRDRLTARLALSNLSQPDFIWSPYRDYISGMQQPVYNVAASWTRTLGAVFTNRLSGGWSDQRVAWSRADPNVPTLAVIGGSPGAIPLLPGSPAAYGLDDTSRYLQIDDTLTAVAGRHILKAGGGAIGRRTDDLLNFGVDGEFFFCNIEHFGFNLPGGCTSSNGAPIPAVQFAGALARGAPVPTSPDLSRHFKSLQYDFFGEDIYRVTPRLVFTLGLRYDHFGAPAYDGGARDWSVQFGNGATFDDRVATASLAPPSAAASSLFSTGGPGLAPRTGFAYDLTRSGHLTLRGGFGIFYDRLFDNLWLEARNNSFIFPASGVAVPGYMPAATALGYLTGGTYVDDFPNLTAFQPHLHNGSAEDSFLGVQSEPVSGLSVEVNGASSLGRRLITTDILNRDSLDNPSLPAINYVANEGLSDYYSLNAVARWRMRTGFLQAAYTWSHAIDLQSDPLAGDFFNLDFVNVGPAPGSSPTAPNGAAFSTENDSRGDRGSADFDQRQTLVFYSYWRIPRGGRSLWRRMLTDLTFSEIAAIRSGFPYSIFTAIENPHDINARARPLNPGNPLLPAPLPALGGEVIFRASAFCSNDTCADPPSGRNAFAGPGLINADASVSRAFLPRWLGESGSLALRADAFNVLNHANLNPPGNIPGNSGYGVAQFGTPPNVSGFPPLIPLTSAARRIQLSLRITF